MVLAQIRTVHSPAVRQFCEMHANALAVDARIMSGQLAECSGINLPTAPRQRAHLPQRGPQPVQCSRLPQHGLPASSPRRSTQVDAAITLNWQGANDAGPDRRQRQTSATSEASKQRDTDARPPGPPPLKINLDLLHVSLFRNEQSCKLCICHHGPA